MISKIRTFLNFPASHKLIFIKVFLLMPLIELSVKTLKFKRTFRMLKFFSVRKSDNFENKSTLVGRYANYTYLCHRNFPFLGNCLARSLTLWFLLKRQRIETTLRFGMKKENEKFSAHCWVEHTGIAIVVKSELVESYVPFSESVLSKAAK